MEESIDDNTLNSEESILPQNEGMICNKTITLLFFEVSFVIFTIIFIIYVIAELILIFSGNGTIVYVINGITILCSVLFLLFLALCVSIALTYIQKRRSNNIELL